MKNSARSDVQIHARELRKNLTDVERLLWSRLRGKQLGVKFRRQYPFLNYVLDFVCVDVKLVIELDGSQHQSALAYDTDRTQCLQDAGYVVLRFWNNQIIEELDNVLEEIYRQVELIKQSGYENPSPSQPSP